MKGFSMHEKLNIKKVLIAISILILLIVSIVVFAISRNMEKNNANNNVNARTSANANANSNNSNGKTKEESTTQVFYDVDNTISVEIPKKYQFEQSYNSEYLIKLCSDENICIYISKLENLESRDLYSVARADKIAYLDEYNSYSNLADLKELEVNGNRAYTYSFHYLDENMKKAFYIQVVLLQIEDEIYVFDVDFPLDDLVLYQNITTELLADFRKEV